MAKRPILQAEFEDVVLKIKTLIVSEDQEPDPGETFELFKRVVELLVESEKDNKDDIYDLFCELNVMDLLSKILPHDKEVVVRTLSLMLINIKNELWISFLMAHPLMVQVIGVSVDEQNEELVEHYISFLKSLAIRLDINNLSLFYNKKFSVFPLVYKGLSFYNHPDNMVRTSVMNLTLGIMKIKDPRLSKYFGTFPFTLYLVHFCLGLNHQWAELEKVIKDNKTTKHKLKMEISDQNDSIYYLHDLFQHGNLTVKSNFKNCLFSICIFPTLINQLMKEAISPKLCLYMFHVILKVFKEKDMSELIACLLFGQRIQSDVVAKINQAPYEPQSFRRVYTTQKEYFSQFEYEVTDHCEQLFKDITNFETEHEHKKSIGQISPNSSEFYNQLKTLSDSLGFDVLSLGENAEHQSPLFQKCKDLQNSLQNPIRNKILRLLEEGDDSTVWLITNIIITIQKKEEISNDTLKFCGLLMPKLDMLNYLDDFNVSSILAIKDILLRHLRKQGAYRVVTVRNIVYLLSELIFKEMPAEDLKELLSIYEESVLKLKGDIRVENIQHLAKTYLEDFKKWGNSSYMLEAFVPFSMFSMSKESFPEIKHEEHLPTNEKEEVTRNIQLFALNRSLVLSYRTQFMKTNKEDIPQFEEGYLTKFNQTTLKWKMGKAYHIDNCTMVECREVYPDKRKPVNLLIVEDPYNFVLVEPSTENELATISLNISYKYMTFELSKEDPRNIALKWITETSGEKMLNFVNEIQAMEVSQRISKRVRNAFEEHQSYILKFVQNCEKDLRAVKEGI